MFYETKMVCIADLYLDGTLALTLKGFSKIQSNLQENHFKVTSYSLRFQNSFLKAISAFLLYQNAISKSLITKFRINTDLAEANDFNCRYK